MRTAAMLRGRPESIVSMFGCALTDRGEKSVVDKVTVRKGMVFVDGWAICDCGSVDCEIAKTLIRQFNEPHVCIATNCCKSICDIRLN